MSLVKNPSKRKSPKGKCEKEDEEEEGFLAWVGSPLIIITPLSTGSQRPFPKHTAISHFSMDQASNIPTSTHSSVSTSTTFTTSPFHADQKEIAAEIEKEWETVWDIFPELSANTGEPVTKPKPSFPPSHKSAPSLMSASSPTSEP